VTGLLIAKQNCIDSIDLLDAKNFLKGIYFYFFCRGLARVLHSFSRALKEHPLKSTVFFSEVDKSVFCKSCMLFLLLIYLQWWWSNYCGLAQTNLMTLAMVFKSVRAAAVGSMS